MKKLFAILLTTSWLWGCSIISPEPLNPLVAIHDRFHGKYKVISSTTDLPVDVNLDGVASTDLTVEIPTLASKADENHYPEYYLELRIGVDYSNGLPPANLLTQWWPSQNIWLGVTTYWQGEQLAYDPDLGVAYESGGIFGLFEFSEGFKKIIVDVKAESFRFRKPESITVIPGDIIQVVTKRPLYTRQGAKNVTITTQYKRFTIIT
ncbi:hypothetical protein [Fibrella aquatilis]|uniref:Uncharacterized protein n=1 Tax=Fibrella aquatilis TaxID=2817059 RepID=A0A939K0G6_9BACT|nr:hypothetical protein [Fibrella aquatilis]MBO0931210.1 hypothetical protein [Fibrella aquatilis]